jgi:hypothetical protein
LSRNARIKKEIREMLDRDQGGSLFAYTLVTTACGNFSELAGKIA